MVSREYGVNVNVPADTTSTLPRNVPKSHTIPVKTETQVSCYIWKQIAYFYKVSVKQSPVHAPGILIKSTD